MEPPIIDEKYQIEELDDDDDDEEEDGEDNFSIFDQDFESREQDEGESEQQGHDQNVLANEKHFYVFLDNKAGMGEASKDKIAKIVHEASKGSKFYKHQEKQDIKIQQRVDAMRHKLQDLNELRRQKLEADADKFIREISKTRCYYRVRCVVDLDAFFASVEERDNPKLKDLPMAVGSGVICTANYVARRYGVRSAMPGFIAKKLCPELIFLPTRFKVYSEISAQTKQIYREYDPDLPSPMSLDEAYLDLTAYVAQKAQELGIHIPKDDINERIDCDSHSFPREIKNENRDAQAVYEAYWQIAEEVVQEIRTRVKTVCGITASAGIATSFNVAKVASNERKPDGQYRVVNELEYLQQLPVRKIGGIGRITERCLTAGLGIETCQQLYEQRALLFAVYTSHTAQWLLSRCLGFDDIGGEKEHHKGRQGMSRETTFHPISDKDDLLTRLKSTCDDLAKDMLASDGIKAKTVTLKLKDDEFNVLTRSKTLTTFISTSDELFHVTAPILLSHMPISLRLMGVRVSRFKPKPSDCKAGNIEAFLQTTRPVNSTGLPVSMPAAKKRKQATGIESYFREVSSSTSRSDSNKLPYLCPICNKPQASDAGLASVNAHIDKCLRESDPEFRPEEEEFQKEKKQGPYPLRRKTSQGTRPLEDFFDVKM